MFKRSLINPRVSPTRLLLTIGLAACLVWLALWIFRGTGVPLARPQVVAATREAEVGGGQQATSEVRTETSSPKLEGEQARVYLEQTSDGQSLMQALTVTRFGLKWQERSPFGSPTNLSLANRGGGYLGMSHDQNLNAWFDEEGVTVRPTVPEKERKRAWQLGLRLKGYGYGAQLQAAPPVVARKVKENRIEYVRSDNRSQAIDFTSQITDFKLQAANVGLTDMPDAFNPKSKIQNPKLIEWYENQSGGIEQGFTLNVRPERSGEAGANEPLRVSLAVEGGLRARTVDEGQKIELVDGTGKGALSYSKLVAQDADGKKLAARMEASTDGREIALTVEDAGARYPIVIDPIVASPEKKLDAGIDRQTDARFGFAVAIDGNMAIVGAWREDSASTPDAGAIYIFTRSGATWTQTQTGGIRDVLAANGQCGYSVAISGTRIVSGCPGANGDTGRAFLRDISNFNFNELTPQPGFRRGGDRYGASVAISGNRVIVGAPFSNLTGVGEGLAIKFTVDSNLAVTDEAPYEVASDGDQLGTSVAIVGDTVILGAPGYSSGKGRTVVFWSSNSGPAFLYGNDGAAGDQFGKSVAISGNTAVVGAPLNRDRGANAGAAYVFVRNTNGNWSQQQKLLGSDAYTDGDVFGADHIAIQGNTIVVGANGWEPTTIINDDYGKAYIFMRSGTVWTQQATIVGDSHVGDNFGIGIGLSGDTVIAGARAATASGVARAGAAYVYRLSCVPPYQAAAYVETALPPDSTQGTACPGSTVRFFPGYRGAPPTSYQWRKNGQPISGATSSIYTINSASASDTGSYDVFVSNACGGEFSTPATLALYTFSLSPTSPQNFGASGSNGIVNVTATGASCGWTAVSNSSFITVNSGASGTGNGTVGFTVAANTGPARTGTITIAGQTFTVTQDGAAASTPTVQFSSASYNVGEGDQRVTLTVTRTGDASGAATVRFATDDAAGAQNCNVVTGVASSRCDYETRISTIRFAAGETARTISIFIIDDSYLEGPENFTVGLRNPSGTSLGSQSTASVVITDNEIANGVNPIDTASFFVQLHYLDFLNRDPDSSGLAFWTGEIASCGTNAQCIESKRINVSAAFYLSIEFQQTGYLIERTYKAAYGNSIGTSTFGGSHQLSVPVVRLNEFLPDTQEIGQGVIVGQTGWEQVLENNKQTFTAGFVQRVRFTTAYPNSITAAQFVDTLNINSGNPLSPSERDGLVADLTSGTKTRAQVLRAVAEDPDLVSAESNRAFVLMQFFGYLRRNPNDPQDTDYTGYDFWLTKLNQFNGNFVNAEMVRAFISSSEYRQRFGP